LDKLSKIFQFLNKVFWIITQNLDNLGKIKVLHPQKHSISYNGYMLLNVYLPQNNASISEQK